ncbi:phosphate metabolism protein 7 [Coemansia sp. RSA 2603]|nr:phosphate metabolism protein 7 [Coemansia sp. RSA 2603]
MRLMLIITSVISVLSAATILPINILGTVGLSGLDSLSMGNVDSRSSRLWVHVGFFALAVVWTMWCVVGELRIYTHLRMWWLTHPDHAGCASANTVLVTDVPRALAKDEPRLKQIFDVLPGGVRQVFVNRTCPELTKTVQKRDKLAHKLEKLLTKYAIQSTKLYERAQSTGDMYVAPKRPTMRKSALSFGRKIEMFEYLAAEIAMCNHFIAQSLKQMQGFSRGSSALVLFNRQVAAHVAAQAVVDYAPFSMSSVTAGVNPQDVIWSNLKVGPWSRRLRGYVSFGVTVALTILWTAITAFVGSLVQVQSLTKLEAFHWLTKSELALGIFSGIVPSVVLAVLMAVSPHILRLLVRLEGTPRHSLVNLRLLHRLYFFQVWNVYLVNISSSSVQVIVANVVANPASVLTRIQQDVPKSAMNILTYVLLLTFIGAAKEILQGVRLALRYVVPMVMSKTPRSIARAERPVEFDWGATIPTHTLVFLMGFSYMFIAPIVTWFVAVYFAMFYLIYRYQFLYVYSDTQRATGGLSYPKTIKQMLVGVYISETYLILMMATRIHGTADSIMRLVVAVAILLFTVAAHLYINDVYMPAIDHLPLKKAADVERSPMLAREFPDVRDTQGNDADDMDDLAAITVEQRRKRNWVYAMYSSLVPASAIALVLRLFPSVLTKPFLCFTDSTEASEMSPRHNDKNRLSMFDSPTIPAAAEDCHQLARMFSSPELRARPVCNLWVPLGNEKIFGRLLWEIEHYGQGTIFVITQGAEITERLRVAADMDFDLAAAEVSDKEELSNAQRQRTVCI